MVQLFLDKDILDKFKYYGEDILKYPELKWNDKFFDFTREEAMRAWWEKLLMYYKIDREKYFYQKNVGTYNYEYLHPGTGPLTVHWQMFRLAVEKLASDEQNAKWMPVIRKLGMIGSYV